MSDDKLNPIPAKAARNRGLADSFARRIQASGGSTLTRQARQVTVSCLCEVLAALDIHPSAPDEITHRHIRRAVEAMVEHGLSTRTLYNRVAHLRALVPRAFGYRDASGNRRTLTNKDLGLSDASRAGTKRAMGDLDFEERLARVEDVGVRACLLIERHLGLRGMEAMRSGTWLKIWEAQLAAGATSIRITEGTKGGRGRDTHLYDPEKALWAVREALKVLEGRKFLVEPPPMREAAKARGKDRPLKRAQSAYARAVRKAGFVGEAAPHALRYAWACARIDAYVAQGYTRDQARMMTACDLGHGDGRGKFVRRVYERQ